MNTGPQVTAPGARDTMIDQAQQQRRVRDTVIMQKVNAAHRGAFRTKFPVQIEHCMRLTAERLQQCLIRRDAEDPAQPESWRADAAVIEHLAQALSLLSDLQVRYPVTEE